MISGCRYERAIKQSMNTLLKTRLSVHSIISEIIASYSHRTLVRPGSYLLCRTYDFFIVSDVLSQHWCKGYFCPPILGIRFYAPDLRLRSGVLKKRIFDPFESPHVGIRSRKFHLKSKFRYEPYPYLSPVPA